MTLAHMKPDWKPGPRQLETLNYIAQGYTVYETASMMYVTSNTVKTTLRILREATNSPNNTSLVYSALRRGWIT